MATEGGGGRETSRHSERRAAREKAAARRLLAERDEARRLLRRKLQWASQAEGLRRDPDALLALVAELYAQLAKLRKEVSTLRQPAQRPDAWLSELVESRPDGQNPTAPSVRARRQFTGGRAGPQLGRTLRSAPPTGPQAGFSLASPADGFATAGPR